MTAQLQKIPRWVRPILGVGLVILGIVLALNSSASIQVFVVLVGCALIIVGVSRLLESFGKNPEAEHDFPWVSGISGILLIVAGIATLLWRGTTLPMLAVCISILMLVLGAESLVALFDKNSKNRVASLISGLAALISGLLVLLWPTLSLWIFGVFFGGWLVFAGLRLVFSFFTNDHLKEASPNSGRFRSLSKLVASTLALILAIAMVLVTAFIHAGDPKLVPDAFYTPPTVVPAEPGALLRVEPLTEGIEPDAEAWRILYTTTNEDGSPAVASGSVVVPRARGQQPLPVISMGHGTKGIIPRCAPTLSAVPLADGPAAALRELVSQGWAGVTSDYVGLGTAGPHPYLVGEAAGRNVLDAYRAATKLEGITLRKDTVLWGHSQGGHGALFSAGIAPDYAPEIGILGVAAMAPASNLVELALGVKDSAPGKVVSSYIADSWNELYPELNIDSMITPGYESAVQRIGDLCFDGRDALAAVISGTQLFDAVLPESTINGPLGDKLRDNSVDMPIKAPLLVAQGLADTLVLPQMQRGWVAERCAAGQRLEYREYAGLDHMPLVGDDSPLIGDLVSWTQDRLAGKEPLNTCT